MGKGHVPVLQQTAVHLFFVCCTQILLVVAVGIVIMIVSFHVEVWNWMMMIENVRL